MTKICPNCKSENTDDATFCQDCGNELLRTADPGTNKNKKTNSRGTMDFWNKQSTGRKAVVGIAGICCIGLILIVAFGGMFSPDKTTTTTPATNTTSTPPSTTSNTTTATGTQVQIIYDGAWSGSINTDGTGQSVDGSGNKDIDIPSNVNIVAAVIQKSEDNSQTLTVNILKDGKIVKSASTSASYGVVSISTSV